jgi:hypothetical protein
MTRRWTEPQGDWLPIVRAVFRFAITHSDGAQSTESFQDESDPFSIEAFEKIKNRKDKADADIFDNETGPLSLHNLTLTLRDKARACRAEIDLDKASFRFYFDLPAGRSSVMNFAPWLIALRRDPVEIHPDAYFNQGNGLVVVGDEIAMHHDQQLKAVRSATDHIWNQLMLPAFARSVSDGRVRIYAQEKSYTEKFRQLPAHLWSKLKFEDWYQGTACDPEGNRYYSIHAADNLPMASPAQAEAPADHGPVRGRGRMKGQGSFEHADQPFISRMRELIADRKATSPEEAARMVAPEAHGNGTPESKATRLGKLYRKTWPDLN